MVVLKVITAIYWLRSAFVCTLVAQADARVTAGEYIMMARYWLASAFVCSLVV